MMGVKLYISLCLLFFSTFGIAQDFRSIDRHAKKAPRKIAKDIEAVTAYLTGNFNSDLEKIRSIYIWIAYNIDYDGSAYRNGRKRINRSNMDVLDRRQAVCYGYATLFKEMCDIAKVPAEIINGYANDRGLQEGDLKAVNHAWNTVLVKGEWKLLDLTWGAGNKQRQIEEYFFTSPTKMLKTHLPADPMWQLLDCPIPLDVFKEKKGMLLSYIESSEPCYNFVDSISAYIELDTVEKRLHATRNAYQYNSNLENSKELGHIYMDFVSVLSDRASQLEIEERISEVKIIHQQIIQTCEIAQQYIELYDHQKENLAYSHINYGIALSREVTGIKDDPQNLLDEMNIHFEKAKNILEELPKNFLLEQALEQVDGYLEWVREY